jgi:sugar/nucleoside kinase (ribokinase family)
VYGSPTVMVIVVVPSDGDRLIYVWPPSGGAHASLTVEQALAGSTEANWLHVSGLCLRVSPARDAILAAMEQANTTGITVSFDLNLRLENWGWDHGFRQVVESAVSRSDIVFGGASEEIVPLAGDDDPVGAALSLADDDRIVIARLGAAGSMACSTDGVVTMPSFPVDVVDTVGAGDAFNAGFIAARLRGDDVPEALRQGNAVAALSVAQPGARSTPTGAQVDAILGR